MSPQPPERARPLRMHERAGVVRSLTALGADGVVPRACLARGARLWLISRAVFSVVLRLAGGNPLDLSPSVAIAMVAACAGLGWADAVRRHERALLGNLAVHPSQYLALVALPAVAGEVLVAVVWRLVR